MDPVGAKGSSKQKLKGNQKGAKESQTEPKGKNMKAQCKNGSEHYQHIIICLSFAKKAESL